MTIKKIFKVVYQDRALNQTSMELLADSWSDIIPIAFGYKKAEEKLISIEQIGEKIV